VTLIRSNGNYVNISVYSNTLEGLLGWRASGGSKQQQQIGVPEWILADLCFVVPCLRGLIETDGCIYVDRGYPMVMFSTVVPGLARQVFAMIEALEFAPHIYGIRDRASGRVIKYQVRLSRNVRPFLDLVKPVKA
jgi:hypothetical protein